MKMKNRIEVYIPKFGHIYIRNFVNLLRYIDHQCGGHNKWKIIHKDVRVAERYTRRL